MPDTLGLTRRQFLAGGAGIGISVLAVPVAAQQAAEATIPGQRILRLREGQAYLRGAEQAPTAIWGYDGAIPGPLIRGRRGERLDIRVINELQQPTAVHWHGLRIDNRMDGAAGLTQAPIPPGGRFDYSFVPPDAGTFWYHPHANTSEQLDRGLSGLLIIDEPVPVDVDRDVALAIDDWRLDDKGQIVGNFGNPMDAMHEGRLGAHLTVNGLPSADIPVKVNERLRLRLANVANSRIMVLRIGGLPVHVVAIDGQPCEAFLLDKGRVLLAPAARCDVMVDATGAPGSAVDITLEGYGQSQTIARIVHDKGEPARPKPREARPSLPANPLPATMDFRQAMRMEVPIEGGAMMMGGGGGAGHTHAMGRGIWQLAGKASDGHSGPPLFSVRRGTVVVLGFPNKTMFPHAMHLHGHHFRLLDNLDDGWKPYWLDTVLIGENRTARIAFIADNPGKWMIHCHMIEHQETGMAIWFEVT